MCEFVSTDDVHYIVFFFFKQKTAYEMRISDWSSDVCSSDLLRISKVPQNRSPNSIRPTATIERTNRIRNQTLVARPDRRRSLNGRGGRHLLRHPVLLSVFC